MRLTLGVRTYDLSTRALVMAVLHVPRPGPAAGAGPTGFDALVGRTEQLVADGADLVELTASKAVGAGPDVSEAEELDVVVPAVGAILERVDVPLACATTRAAVAREAFAAGVVMGHDASGFADSTYVPAAVEAGAAVAAGHPGPEGPDLVTRVHAFLAERARWADAAGLPPDRLVVDTGLDRCPDPERFLELLRGTAVLAALGRPLLVSVSPPPAIDPAPAPPWGTVAAGAVAVVRGARLLRTGDVRAARRMADVVAAIVAAP